jgi:FkbM family methyltransferase
MLRRPRTPRGPQTPGTPKTPRTPGSPGTPPTPPRTLRTLLERLSRDRVLRRRLPPELGGRVLLVSPDSAMKLWRRDLRHVDPLLFRLAHEQVLPGSSVWDVGANVGLFAAAAAHFAGAKGTVLAIEADDWLATLLRRSAAPRLPNQAPIEVLSAAAASRCGTADFCLANRGRAASHLATVAGSSEAGGTRAVQQVVTVTLDSLLDRYLPPHLVKIDVEGAELECLLGAGELLRRHHPTLICEVSPANAQEVGRLLHDSGYVLYDAEAAPPRRERLAIPTWNTLAIAGGES